MSVEQAQLQYLAVTTVADYHSKFCGIYLGLPCPVSGKLWLKVEAASIYLDLAAAMADRERTLQLAGVDDASSNAPRQG